MCLTVADDKFFHLETMEVKVCDVHAREGRSSGEWVEKLPASVLLN